MYKKILKKLQLWILVLLLTFGSVVPVFGVENDEIETPIEELTEEEQKLQLKKEQEKLFLEAVKKEEHKDLEELTTAYLLGDFETKEIFYSYNIDEMVAIASTTKILTVFVVMDQVEAGTISLDDIVHIDRECASITGSSYDLKEGETVTVQDLVRAAMVVSGNDATRALAKHVAGSEEKFVQMMGEKLRSLDIKEFNLVNSSGLPNYNLEEDKNQNMMTTRDLFLLSCYFLEEYPEILDITKLKGIVEPDRDYEKDNTNPLLGKVKSIDGLKTGYTGAAGRCMVATGIVPAVADQREELRLIGITMGSENDAQRYVAIKRIMEEGLDTYEKRILIDTEVPVEYIPGVHSIPEEIPVYIPERLTLLVDRNDPIHYELDVDELIPPLDPGKKVGYIHIYVDEEPVLSSPLIIQDKVREQSLLGFIMRFYEEAYVNTIKLFDE